MTIARSLGLALALFAPVAAADETDWRVEQVQQILVVGASRSHVAALAQLERIAKRSGMTVNLRGLRPLEDELSFSLEVCDRDAGGYPCYQPRGLLDDGAYLSIETSSSYQGMRPGYFVIVAATGREEVALVRRSLKRKGVGGTVYSVPVYMGCRH
jgi:hypothetical protein